MESGSSMAWRKLSRVGGHMTYLEMADKMYVFINSIYPVLKKSIIQTYMDKCSPSSIAKFCDEMDELFNTSLGLLVFEAMMHSEEEVSAMCKKNNIDPEEILKILKERTTKNESSEETNR